MPHRGDPLPIPAEIERAEGSLALDDSASKFANGRPLHRASST